MALTNSFGPSEKRRRIPLNKKKRNEETFAEEKGTYVFT